MSDFVAIDFELANNNLTSICQVGIAVFENSIMVDNWDTLVNPQEDFLVYNTRIHGITARQVDRSPKKVDLIPELKHYLNNQYVVSYGLLDMHVIQANFPELIHCHWLDATTIVRKVWPQFNKGGFGLNKMAEFLSIKQERHHDALDDAIVCGEIVAKALQLSKTAIRQWHVITL